MKLSGEISDFVERAVATAGIGNKRVLLIVPDGTRTAPIEPFFRTIAAQIPRLDVMIALGTHPPMDEDAICRRLGITPEERATRYAHIGLHNHAWQDPSQLRTLGTIPAREIAALTEGRFAMDVEVTINRAALEAEHLLILGPTFPHEVVGFSGGAKYLFPGISGPEVLNFFHWLGAVITSSAIIGEAWTPVRAVIHRAADMVPTPSHAFCLVADKRGLAGAYFGPLHEAWRQAAEHSASLHIVRKPRPFHTVLSCAPAMYDDLWVGGKCMYKLEPVVADGGELIIVAPHINTISRTHGAAIERLGYHVRDTFLAQWDRFKDEPWGVLAHSTHVKGTGTFRDGIETPRIRVTLATAIPREVCERVNLGYRDPATLRLEDFKDREAEGILLVSEAGETLYRLGS